ncbi:histidine kinase [Gilvimarinus sp. 2_MG-2023]|uniref:sensor histidine kinase n=1 Tax=Gilvimarinus sp. 2_MG-2023 TaxID=3062666 RepID=UPI0026E24B35|nr:histidine kinase [Gilvimarinus sp. 2_MG-2023]MDO6569708.1 histidine kinase [Gilvimarinus sp. 2_MG-2023]
MGLGMMAQGKQQHNGQATGLREALGFIPNLCTGYALLLLILAAELLSVLLVVANSGLRDLRWAELGLVSFLVQWVVLSSASILCYLQSYLARLGPMRAGLISYAIVLVVTMICSLGGQWLLRDIGKLAIDWWQVASHLVIAAVLAGIILRYLYLQQQLQKQQQAELRARIQALQSRIEPHFLFNSMNSIASLIAVDPQLAERQVEDLSDLMRASLAEVGLISAARELQLCRSYLHIQQARLGQRLQVNWQVQPLPEALLLPNLLLQPLVENAIKYGVEPDPQGGQVTVQADIRAEVLELVVINSLPVSDINQPSAGNQMALENIHHRLAAHYGVAASLAVDNKTDQFKVSVTIELTACLAQSRPRQS